MMVARYEGKENRYGRIPRYSIRGSFEKAGILASALGGGRLQTGRKNQGIPKSHCVEPLEAL